MSGEAPDNVPVAGSEPEKATVQPPQTELVAARWVEEDDEITLLKLANVLLNRWKLVVGVPVGAAVGAALVLLPIPPKFTATTTFVPAAEESGTRLPASVAGFASQLGIGVPGNENSPEFYAGVLESRTVRDQVLLVRFAAPRSEETADSAALLDILGVEGESETERLENGREELDDMVSVTVDRVTSVVSISVETRHRALSAAVANRFVELLSQFNLETRQSSVQARRQFVEERLSEAQVELRQAEEDRQSFLERNREFRDSPQLEFQDERLQRQVAIKQEVLITLRREYEEARIQEVNDAPVITVIDQAVPPQKRSGPRRLLNVLFAFVLGGTVGIFGVFGQEFVEHAKNKEPEEFRKLASRWRRMRSLGTHKPPLPPT